MIADKAGRLRRHPVAIVQDHADARRQTACMRRDENLAFQPAFPHVNECRGNSHALWSWAVERETASPGGVRHTFLRPATSTTAAADAAALRQLIMGFRMTQMIHAAASLGVADQLRDSPKSARALAAAVGAHPASLGRLLRALATVGIFRETKRGEFELTARARLLCSDTPGSLRGMAVLYGEDWLWRAYGHTAHAVRTGEPGFDQVHGVAFYPYLQAHPHAAARFDDAMSGYSAIEARAIVEAFDFSDVPSIVDVGGGQGVLAAALLHAHPRLHATVFDLAGPIAEARRIAVNAGLHHRCNCVAGDFFVEVPPADGVVLLKSVLHNWDDSRAIVLLRNCRRAMQSGARLLIAERLLAAGDAPSEAALFDINMLVVAAGQERTQSQYRALLARAGFAVTRVIATASALSLIEARPA